MIVVDNGSVDDTADVARALGARVVQEPRPGYGAAVHAGVEAATRDCVAVMDGDGSFDPPDLLPLLDDVRSGTRRPRRGAPAAGGARRLALARARRQRAGRGAGCAGGRLPGARHRTDPRVPAGTAARPRRARTDGSATRSSCCSGATAAGWRISEHDVAYHPRAAGTRSKVSGSVRGTVRTARDFWRVLA